MITRGEKYRMCSSQLWRIQSKVEMPELVSGEDSSCHMDCYLFLLIHLLPRTPLLESGLPQVMTPINVNYFQNQSHPGGSTFRHINAEGLRYSVPTPYSERIKKQYNLAETLGKWYKCEIFSIKFGVFEVSQGKKGCTSLGPL